MLPNRQNGMSRSETRSLLDLAGSTAHIMIYTHAGSTKVEQQDGEKWSRKEIHANLLNTARTVVIAGVGAACNVCHCGCWLMLLDV